MEATANENITVAQMNRKLMALLERGETDKVAQATSEVCRTQLREDSFAMNLVVPTLATDDMLDRTLGEDLQIIEEIEPDGPGAKWVAFQTVPEGEYIRGSRYAIPFARIMTPKFQKDIDELRTYRYDIRDVLSQNSIKDGLEAYDGRVIETFIGIAEDTLSGNPGAQRVSGKVQWLGASGGMTKDNLVEGFKLLPRGNASGKFRMRNNVMVMNDVTAQDLKKLDVSEIGDENVSKIWREGLTSDMVLGLKSVFTIKDNLVPDNTVWFLPEQKFIGKAYYLTDWTMYMKKEDVFIEMYARWLGGMGVGNIASICKADFDVS